MKTESANEKPAEQGSAASPPPGRPAIGTAIALPASALLAWLLFLGWLAFGRP